METKLKVDGIVQKVYSIKSLVHYPNTLNRVKISNCDCEIFDCTSLPKRCLVQFYDCDIDVLVLNCNDYQLCHCYIRVIMNGMDEIRKERNRYGNDLIDSTRQHVIEDFIKINKRFEDPSSWPILVNSFQEALREIDREEEGCFRKKAYGEIYEKHLKWAGGDEDKGKIIALFDEYLYTS